MNRENSTKLGELKKRYTRISGVREEMRRNLIRMIEEKNRCFRS